MKLLIGNFRGPEGKQGKKGEMGETGATGQRGSRWTSGTAVTGTSTAGTIFPETNITDAKLYDYYVNTDTGNLYECTVAGAADVAEWTHIGNIRGPAGATGPAGSISEIEEQKPAYTEAAKLENISSGETVKVAFGKLKKAVSVLIAHYTQKATAAILGHVKLSNSAAITKTGEYALDAVEKNASVAGTLANLIAQQNSNLNNLHSDLFKARYDGKGHMPHTGSDCNDAPFGFSWDSNYILNGVANCPPIYGGYILRLGEPDWGAEVAISRDSFCKIYIRNVCNGTWTDWVEK